MRTRLSYFVAFAFVLSLASGCVVTLKDNGEAGFRQSSEFSFFHRTSRTDAESKAEASSSVVDKLLEPKPNDNAGQ